MSAVIHILPVGLNEQEQSILKVATNLLAAYDYKVAISSDSNSELAVINLDSDEGRQFVSSSAPGQRKLLISDNAGGSVQGSQLTRPVRVQTLKDSLVELLEIDTSSNSAPAAAPTAAKPTAPAKQVPAPQAKAAASGDDTSYAKKSLMYAMVCAVNRQVLLKVDGGFPAPVMIHGPSKTLYSRMSDVELGEAFAQLKGLEVNRLEESPFMQACNGVSQRKVEVVLWQADKLGGLGDLLPGNSTTQAFKIRAWPRFNTRFTRPDYLRLAALFSKQPSSIEAAAAANKIPLTTVIDFYNCALTSGVVEHTEKAEEIKTNGARFGGLLGKIARKLALK